MVCKKHLISVGKTDVDLSTSLAIVRKSLPAHNKMRHVVSLLRKMYSVSLLKLCVSYFWVSKHPGKDDENRECVRLF